MFNINRKLRSQPQRQTKALPLIAAILFIGSCASQPNESINTNTHGVSVAAHPEAARVGAEILQAGGNAVDAAIATGFAIAVVEPTMNGIGGRSLALVRTGEGRVHAYDAMTEIPASYVRPEEPKRDGYGVIATPGMVAALGRLHQEHGSLPWASLLAPAIHLAEEGFALLPGEAARQAQAKENFQDNLGFQQVFLTSAGDTYAAGETLRQPGLAGTLKTIANEGAMAFYEGDIAASIASDMRANGGHVTADDLATYRVRDGRYISTRYRDFEIHAMAAPGGGGLVIKTLNMLENFDLSNMSNAAWAATVNQALALSVNTMQTDYKETDLDQVVSKEWARGMAKEISVPELRSAEQPSTHPAALIAQHDWTGASWGTDSHHTTHFVTADCEGTTVSITQTLGPLFGSKVITPGLGFVYATTMGTYLAAADESPGSRPRTTISPTIITRDGEIEFVLGAAGGLRIASGIVQTISRYVDHGLSLEQAVAAPRIHPNRFVDEATGARTAMPLSFHAETTPETGWQPQDVESWRAAGFEVQVNDRVGAFSRVHAAGRDASGWYGVADPDWEGVSVSADVSFCSRSTGP